MGILDRLFKRSAAPAAGPDVEPAECRHLALSPRWDSADDMGKMDRVTRYLCEGCHREFTPQEAEAIKATNN